MEKKERKRIVLSSNTAFSLYNFRLHLMRTLKEKGYEVITVSPEDGKYSELLKKEFSFFPVKSLDRKGKNPIKDLKLFFEYFLLFRRLKPDIVINFTIKPNIYGSISAGLLGIPSISVITGLGYVFIREIWLTKFVKLLYWLAFRFNRAVVFLNSEDLNTLRNFSKEKSFLIESEGIDIKHFDLTLCKEAKKDEFAFLFVGRLLTDKGICELIKAFESLKKEKPKVKLIIVGSPDEGNPNSVSKGELEKWVKEGLIEWHGFQEDVRPFYCMANCVVLPSYREGIPRVLLEAMAMEKPIITTDAPGCRNVCVDGVNGFLVKPKDVESLYFAMKRMVELGDEKLREFGKAGRRLAEEKYSVEKIVGEYINLIEAVLSKS
ncbi:MAG: glycosyltransferase family 4 protein [Thermocrinis sp.]|jgi:glycosyltransferase involved in cell wall biosynthesis|uniref:glycosyltransferase family 4 protein n=1 Tax=Thermocrinis sp. TaxID=2024383 RepID=UPI003C04A501